jgi:glycosyltransferase involved in cell wall biosynthesis
MSVDSSDQVGSKAQPVAGKWGKAHRPFDTIVRRESLRVGAAIGVSLDGHAESLLKIPTVETLYGVESNQGMVSETAGKHAMQAGAAAGDQHATAKLCRFGDRYRLLRQPSRLAAASIREELDFVYLNAAVAYPSVAEELSTWLEKVRDGGILGGDGYDHSGFASLRQGVSDFFGRFAWKINVEADGVWWVKKAPIHISFIMPAYNCWRTVEASVESIFSGNFLLGDEVVVVNDASTDGTARKLEDLRSRHPEIKLVHHRINRGGGAARNTAVADVANQLVFCLDADNLLMPGSVGQLKTYLVKSGADIACFGEIHFFDEKPEETNQEWRFRHEDFTFADQLAGTISPSGSGNYLFTLRSWAAAGGYPDSSGALDTWGFGLRQLASGYQMKVLAGTFYQHRISDESYYVRDSRSRNLSLTALQILSPYLDLLDPGDAEYVVGEIGRTIWFNELGRRPIRLRNGAEGVAGYSTSLSSFRRRLASIGRKVKRRIQAVFQSDSVQ